MNKVTSGPKTAETSPEQQAKQPELLSLKEALPEVTDPWENAVEIRMLPPPEGHFDERIPLSQLKPFISDEEMAGLQSIFDEEFNTTLEDDVFHNIHLRDPNHSQMRVELVDGDSSHLVNVAALFKAAEGDTLGDDGRVSDREHTSIKVGVRYLGTHNRIKNLSPDAKLRVAQNPTLQHLLAQAGVVRVELDENGAIDQRTLVGLGLEYSFEQRPNSNQEMPSRQMIAVVNEQGELVDMGNLTLRAPDRTAGGSPKSYVVTTRAITHPDQRQHQPRLGNCSLLFLRDAGALQELFAKAMQVKLEQPAAKAKATASWVERVLGE